MATNTIEGSNHSKRLDQSVKPFSLEQCCYPINNPIHYTCHRTVDNDGAGDLEHFRADAEDKPLAFEFDGGGGDRVGKAGDRHQRAGAGVLGDTVVDAVGGEDDRKRHNGKRSQ